VEGAIDSGGAVVGKGDAVSESLDQRVERTAAVLAQLRGLYAPVYLWPFKTVACRAVDLRFWLILSCLAQHHGTN
jgi:hypothetical protein